MELSVAEVSGLIAAGVFVLQFSLSLIYPAALIGFVNEENTAVTWSVLGRALQASPWPTFLQTDTAAREGVKRRVSNGLLLQTTIILLISVAAIVTPIGLYQVVEPGGEQLEAFRYVEDDSSFGYGTPDRLAAPFMRGCANEPCPGSWMNQTCVMMGAQRRCNGTVYGRDIPDAWKSTLRDGANRMNQSVSSIFDIQWRSQTNVSDPFGEWGWYLESGYRQIGILILDPGIHLVDGLIVDAQNGGIGFRNHTVPAPLHEHGSTWSEDILFIEPDTQCVDLNITFDFELTEFDTTRLRPWNTALTDRGGFSGLSRTSPDLSIPNMGNGQGPLDLRERAYKAAWYNNFLTLAYFNATEKKPGNITRLDVTPGMAFQSDTSPDLPGEVQISGTNFYGIEYQSIRSTLWFGDYLRLNGSEDRSNSTINPHNVNWEDFYHLSTMCAGGSTSNRGDINSTTIGCGLLYGAARRSDGGSELSPQPGSAWSIPVYSCAASIHATIRTVTFQHNGTNLAALKATSAIPKTYPSPDQTPLWAVEDTHTHTLSDAPPLWGVLGPSHNPVPIPATLSQRKNLTTISAASLNLPGILTQLSPFTGIDYAPQKAGQNLPGVEFYVQALLNTFSIERPGSVGYAGYADYSGRTGLALYKKWQTLSASAEGAAEIVKLVWTDVAANSVVGTRGWGLRGNEGEGGQGGLRKRDGGEGGDELVKVTVYRRRVRYVLPYMVPAIVVLVLATSVLVTLIVMSVMGRTGLAKLRRLLDATSPGRILGGFLWPGKAATGKGTNEWVKAVGTKVVIVGTASGDAVGVAAREEDGDQAADGEQEGEVKVGEESIRLMGKDRPVSPAA